MTIPLTASALRSAPIPLPSSPVAERPLSFDTYGDSGPWVVLLHGIPGWRGTFAEVGARLGSTCRVLVPDLLGFGDSPEAPADFHAEQHAAVVIDLLRARGVDRFHLVGFDFGGPTAVLVAGRLGDRVQSITVAATNIFPDTPVPLPLRLAKIPILGRLLFRLLLGRLGLMMMFFAAVADRSAFPRARYRAALRGHGPRTTRRIFFASMRDLPGRRGALEPFARPALTREVCARFTASRASGSRSLP